MTQRELVIAALNHEETRPIPYHIDLRASRWSSWLLIRGIGISGSSWGCV